MADEDLSMESIMRLAQQLQGAPPPAVNTAPPSNELGLLGRLFGGGGGGLSTDQQEMQARQAMMAFGAQLSDAASRPLPYGGRRDFMAGVGEANQAAWGTSAAYAKQARDQAKEDREERRAQFGDRMQALDAASKIGKMQADLQALRLKRTGLDEPGTGTATGGAGGGAAPTGSLQFTGDLEKDRILIKQRESGGDPTALNYVARADPSARAKGATASGLYGFVDSTWREGLGMIGGDAKAYPTAQSAPPEVQDKVFDAIYKARGTAPWDPSKWGKNWAKKADGSYELVATGTSGTSGTSSTPPTPPPYKTASTTAVPPPTGSTPPPPTQQPPAAPAAQPALPEAEARAKAAETGQPVPMLGSDGKPSGLVIKPDGSMANAPPPTATATAPTATATATAPQQPDDTIGLPPGVPGYRAFREANLRQPTDEDRRLFSGDLTPEDKQSVQSERARLERALQNAQRARQLEGGDASTIVAAQTKLAEHEAKVREAAATARAKGKEIEAGWWKDQETQLRTAHGKLIEGAETRLTADNAVTNARKTKAFEGLDSDVKLAGDRIASFDVLRTLSRQVDGNSLVSAINVNGTPLVDILAAGKWGSPETLRGYSIIQAYRQMASLAVKEVKEGMSMGSMSDRDLTFIENMIPRLSQDPYARELGISLLEGAQRRKRDVALRANALMTDGKMNPAQAYAQAQEEAPRIIANVPAKFDINADAITPAQKAERIQWFRDNVRPGQAFRTPDGRVDIYFGDQPKPPGFKHLWELGTQ